MTASSSISGDLERASACLSTLRDTDRDRYLACLLSPEDKRAALAALYAFNAEIARIRDLVREPLPGEIRLQWWRDLLDGNSSGEGNPVAEELLVVIEAHRLPRQTFMNMIDARLFDLYDDPLPDRGALEGYAGETASALIQLASLILAPEEAAGSADRAGHAGVAQAIAGFLLLLPIHSRRGQMFLPQDILSATGLDRDAFLAGERNEQQVAAVEALAGLGLDHLARARAAGPVPSALVGAYLPVALAGPVLVKASRHGGLALEGKLLLPQWRRQVQMMKTAFLRRF
ncbi:MAG: phytoene/squalene synthase family protein [Neorhizobium sp.]|nr:phytoene/squalene synthase family protein [Neorhizobium sp.]